MRAARFSRRGSSSVIARLRRLWWQRVRRYRYEVCDDCGRPVAARAFGLETRTTVAGEPELAPVTYWFADNALWNTVVGGERGVLCPACFTRKAEQNGERVGWRAGRVGAIECDCAAAPEGR